MIEEKVLVTQDFLKKFGARSKEIFTPKVATLPSSQTITINTNIPATQLACFLISAIKEANGDLYLSEIKFLLADDILFGNNLDLGSISTSNVIVYNIDGFLAITVLLSDYVTLVSAIAFSLLVGEDHYNLITKIYYKPLSDNGYSANDCINWKNLSFDGVDFNIIDADNKRTYYRKGLSVLSILSSQMSNKLSLKRNFVITGDAHGSTLSDLSEDVTINVSLKDILPDIYPDQIFYGYKVNKAGLITGTILNIPQASEDQLGGFKLGLGDDKNYIKLDKNGAAYVNLYDTLYVPQWSALPKANDYQNFIVQYVGSSTDELINGFFYKSTNWGLDTTTAIKVGSSAYRINEETLYRTFYDFALTHKYSDNYPITESTSFKLIINSDGDFIMLDGGHELILSKGDLSLMGIIWNDTYGDSDLEAEITFTPSDTFSWKQINVQPALPVIQHKGLSYIICDEFNKPDIVGGPLSPEVADSTSIYMVLAESIDSEEPSYYKEYLAILDGEGYKWELIGTTEINIENYYSKDEADHLFKTLLTVVSDPDSKGETTDFIATITQDKNGKIKVTKSTVTPYTEGKLITIDNHKVSADIPTVKHELIYSDDEETLTTKPLMVTDGFVVTNLKDFELTLNAPGVSLKDFLKDGICYTDWYTDPTYGEDPGNANDFDYVEDGTIKSQFGRNTWHFVDLENKDTLLYSGTVTDAEEANHRYLELIYNYSNCHPVTGYLSGHTTATYHLTWVVGVSNNHGSSANDDVFLILASDDGGYYPGDSDRGLTQLVLECNPGTAAMFGGNSSPSSIIVSVLYTPLPFTNNQYEGDSQIPKLSPNSIRCYGISRTIGLLIVPLKKDLVNDEQRAFQSFIKVDITKVGSKITILCSDVFRGDDTLDDYTRRLLVERPIYIDLETKKITYTRLIPKDGVYYDERDASKYALFKVKELFVSTYAPVDGYMEYDPNQPEIFDVQTVTRDLTAELFSEREKPDNISDEAYKALLVNTVSSLIPSLSKPCHFGFGNASTPYGVFRNCTRATDRIYYVTPEGSWIYGSKYGRWLGEGTNALDTFTGSRLGYNPITHKLFYSTGIEMIELYSAADVTQMLKSYSINLVNTNTYIERNADELPRVITGIYVDNVYTPDFRYSIDDGDQVSATFLNGFTSVSILVPPGSKITWTAPKPPGNSDISVLTIKYYSKYV